MPSNLRIFLSSTCIDLFQERRDIARALIDAGHTVLMSEDAQNLPISPFVGTVKNCLEAIRGHSDILVLVISSRYGSDSGSGRSVTEEEYEEAKKLGIPIYTFVRRSVRNILPIFANQPDSDFSPIVEDNRVLQLLSKISDADSKWLFEFDAAEDIAAEVKYQISCLTKSELSSRAAPSGELLYRYTNNSTVLLHPSGRCLRKLEYEIKNDTREPVTRINLGDASDLPFAAGDEKFVPIDELGNQLEFEYVVQNAQYRSWDVLLPTPLEPDQSTRFHCSFLSADIGSMNTGHQRRTDHGLISYYWPRTIVDSVTGIWVREDHSRERIPLDKCIRSFDECIVLSYGFYNISGKWRFEVHWDLKPD